MSLVAQETHRKQLADLSNSQEGPASGSDENREHLQQELAALQKQLEQAHLEKQDALEVSDDQPG